MNRAFPDAAVTGYEAMISDIANDPKDRHVLAAAGPRQPGIRLPGLRAGMPTGALTVSLQFQNVQHPVSADRNRQAVPRRLKPDLAHDRRPRLSPGL